MWLETVTQKLIINCIFLKASFMSACFNWVSSIIVRKKIRKVNKYRHFVKKGVDILIRGNLVC